MIDWNQINSQIGKHTGKPFQPIQTRSIGGGCINSCFFLSDGNKKYFVKTNASTLSGMFEVEAAGLKLIADTESVRTPRPICLGIAQPHAYLVLEYIAMGGPSNNALAGERLAALHGNLKKQFGWDRDNNIGSTRQPNHWSHEWIDFWRSQRLGFQLQQAAKQGYIGRLQQRGDKLLDLFPELIDHNPEPSLIHGDLWSGNLGYQLNGDPVIYDPAVYFADREAEIAMTELFGGFGSSFYRAYNNAWMLDRGYATRKNLYNLYHILNHLNLFGGGYADQALSMIDSLLAELGH
ncbi:MAG: fructosamine kinase family protein [Gammaproteobacteria bacterium]|nr:fructosamine kinase family protein [Gammaproteobacteria bacterium]